MELESESLNILLVEDDEMVRVTTRDMLQRTGFSVVTADSPQEALMICRTEPISIDLIITDVIMPNINGPQLLEQILSIRPGVKVLYTSGHPEDVITGNYGMKIDRPFIQKPYSLKELIEKVREITAS